MSKTRQQKMFREAVALYCRINRKTPIKKAEKLVRITESNGQVFALFDGLRINMGAA